MISSQQSTLGSRPAQGLRELLARYSLIVLPALAGGCSGSNLPLFGPNSLALSTADRQLVIYDSDARQFYVVADTAVGSVRASPDGDRIAYVAPSRRWSGSRQVYVVSKYGGESYPIGNWIDNGLVEEHPDGANRPVWSPDGSAIAFSRCIGCEGGGADDVFLAPAIRSSNIDEVRLTTSIWDDDPEDWAPNGQSLLILSNRPTDGMIDLHRDLYSLDLGDTTLTMIIDSDSTFSVGSSRYSPSGEEIAFLGRTPGPTLEIYLCNSDGTGITQLTENELHEFGLTWSPDGTRIAFVAGPDFQSEFSGGHLYILDIDSGQTSQITSGLPKYYAPDWLNRQLDTPREGLIQP